MYRNNPTISKFLRATHYLEDGLLISLLGTMIVLAVSQIFMRNFFSSGFSWASPLLGILVLWLGLAGSIVASRQKNHISIDILSRYLSKKASLLAEVCTDFFTAIVSGVIAYHSVRFVMSEYEYNVIAFDSIPAWICELIIPVAFTIICLRYFAQAIENLILFSSRKIKK